MSRGVKDPVKLKNSRVFVKLVFAVASLRDLNKSLKVLRGDTFGRDIVPDIHTCFSLFYKIKFEIVNVNGTAVGTAFFLEKVNNSRLLNDSLEKCE